MELEATPEHHDFICDNEVAFNLCKTRCRGRNLIGHRAIVSVPGQRGGNIIVGLFYKSNVETSTDLSTQIKLRQSSRVIYETFVCHINRTLINVAAENIF